MRDRIVLTGRGAVARAAGRVCLMALAAGMAWGSGAAAADAAKQPAKISGTWLTVGDAGGKAEFPAVGSFRARQAARLGFQVSGRVQDVLVDVGDVVRTGQELIKLDPSFFQIEVTQRKADVDAAQVSLEEATLNLNRMKSLFDKPAGELPSVSRKQYDDAQTQYDGASARLRGAEGALRFAQKRLDETVVLAPFNAVVSKRLVDPGEPVNSAPITYVLEVQEVQILDLEFSLPQDMLSRIKIGTPVTYDIDGVTPGHGRGTINIIYPALDEATRSFRCRAMVQNPDFKFKPGMLAHVNVQEGPASAAAARLTIPRSALTWTDGAWQVRVDQGGKTVARAVRVGTLTDETAEIQDGLQAGDRVWIPAKG
ncbi:MAG: efflux RND transporter periplasmic adaptor subunit [SAR324 cluster bacterium]